MFRNQLKAKCYNAASSTAFGVFIGFPSTQLVEMAAYTGFDAVVIDNEHGMLSAENVEHMVMAAELTGITPLVRVVSSDPAELLKAMDRGAHGVHVPQVETASEAIRIVEAVKYPPVGRRGAAFSMRAARFGTVPLSDYLERANEESFICIHIETGKALDNLQEILEVQGVDAVYIGPTDLSVSLGCKGDVDHPEVRKAMEQIRHAAVAAGRKLGIHSRHAAGAVLRQAWGADYVGVTVTSLVTDAFSEYIRAVKTKPEQTKEADEQ
ncbi:HpcH/HpaI aldolase family protein [Paenibacillus koleovorans]|uniref:HpcH/HpaI aldolase family protein n=1 Tax=Paenibacillus koleovorans TaxID=121608 RepID=UPI000FDB6806|nr:aldolase/citrate lyase family protein [Paenibacillus koleovorans]